MKALVKVMVLFVALGFGMSSFANTAPEIFTQPEIGKLRVQLTGEYRMLEIKDGAAVGLTDYTDIKPTLWFDYGLTHNVAFRLGTSFSIYEEMVGNVANPTGFTDEAFNNIDLDIIGHNSLGAMDLFWGIEASITPDKSDKISGNGVDNFTGTHFFVPYLGLAVNAGPAVVGIKASFDVFVADPELANHDNGIISEHYYTAGVFGEMNVGEMALVGLNVDYNFGGSDDVYPAGKFANYVVAKDTLYAKLYGTVGMTDGVQAVFGAQYAMSLDSDRHDTYSDLAFKLGVRYTY